MCNSIIASTRKVVYWNYNLPLVAFLAVSGTAYTMLTGTRRRAANVWRDKCLNHIRSLSKVEELGHIGLSVGRSHDDGASLGRRANDGQGSVEYALRLYRK